MALPGLPVSSRRLPNVPVSGARGARGAEGADGSCDERDGPLSVL